MFRKIIDFFKYDSTGYDKDGYDRESFDRSGFNKYGLDREGFNRSGYNKDGYDREGFDRFRFNKDGYDREGFDKEGIHKETKTLYDLTGYDREDFDRSGLNRENKTRIQSLQEEVISILEFESFDNSLDFLELKGILENCTPIDRFQIFPKDKVYIFDLVEHKLLVPLECDENSTLGKKILHHRVPFIITLLNEHRAIVVYRY